MGFLNHVEISRNFTLKYGLPLPQYTVYPDPNSKTESFFLAQIIINEHFVIQAGPTSELAENRAALKLLLLLMRSYDVCDKDFYNNDDKKMLKMKISSMHVIKMDSKHFVTHQGLYLTPTTILFARHQCF